MRDHRWEGRGGMWESQPVLMWGNGGVGPQCGEEKGWDRNSVMHEAVISALDQVCKV